MSVNESAAGTIRFGLTIEQREIADLAFSLGAKYGDRRFDDHEASLAQWDDLAESGFTALSLPEEHGGLGGMLELVLVAERLAAGGFPAAKLVIATSIAGSIIGRNGSPEQLERWLPGMAAGTTRFCFALTEPAAGSNSRNLRTFAERTPAGWRVRGEKTYISALESSDAMLLVTRMPEHDGGFGLFAFPLPWPGIEANRIQVETVVQVRSGGPAAPITLRLPKVAPTSGPPAAVRPEMAKPKAPTSRVRTRK